MEYTREDAMRFIEENDVKFIRLAFCDIFGEQKNISVMPEELPRAFESGISFDASAVRGFLNVDESDLFIVPDPSTLSVLPWRPSHGGVVRLYCDIYRPDGTPFEGDARAILRHAAAKARKQGLLCSFGTECEFYLFQTDANGDPELIPQDRAGYCDIAPRDRGENVRREICLTLEKMGIRPETSHHEQGPGQNEIDFRYSSPLCAADHLITFRSVVKTVAAHNGLYASFMPKPLHGYSGSGMHINLSLREETTGKNLFDANGGAVSATAEHFMAGILNRIDAFTAFLNPLPNSYARLGEYEAPEYITWSRQNRSQLIRIPAAVGEYSRMELRSPDAACNPYLAFALLISAGLEGVRLREPLCAPTDLDLYHAHARETQALRRLPESLQAALALAEESAFVRAVLPEQTVNGYLLAKKAEWERYWRSPDKEQFDREVYFPMI